MATDLSVETVPEKWLRNEKETAYDSIFTTRSGAQQVCSSKLWQYIYQDMQVAVSVDSAHDLINNSPIDSLLSWTVYLQEVGLQMVWTERMCTAMVKLFLLLSHIELIREAAREAVAVITTVLECVLGGTWQVVDSMTHIFTQ